MAAVAPESGPDGAPTRAAPDGKLEACARSGRWFYWRPNVHELGWAGGRAGEREGGAVAKTCAQFGSTMNRLVSAEITVIV